MTFRDLNKLNYIEKTIIWIHDTIDARQFLIFSSILVGLTAGLASVILKMFVHLIKEYVLDGYLLKVDFKFVYLFLPFIGIGLTILIVKFFFQGKLNRGTASILFSVAKKGSFLAPRQMYSHIITSALTVGFGGSAGLESPIVSTGSAIGSNFAQRYKLSYKDRTLLLAAGAAGGIAGAFNAPIAGVLFALEVLLIDINISAFIPLLIASASGTLISKILLKESVLLYFDFRQPFDYHNLGYYIIMALLAGIVSIYHVNFFNRVEERFEKINSLFKKWLLSCCCLALVLAFFPSLYGEGYDSIKNLANMQSYLLFKDSVLYGLTDNRLVLILLVLASFLLKAVAVGITLGGGGNGGNFAPSLFVGAGLGFVFASTLQLLGFQDIPVVNFTLVTMAGILSGVFHAPLTAIFLIAEITGGYELIIPLMLVSSTSFAFVKYFHPESIEIRKLKKRGAIISDDKDTTILAKIEVTSLLDKSFSEIRPDDSLRQIVESVKHSKRNTYPVIDKKGCLFGIIFLDDIREEMFDLKLYDKVHARELVYKRVTKIFIDDDIFTIMKKFDESGQWNLPVVESDNSYLGFIAKSSILTKYREELILSR